MKLPQTTIEVGVKFKFVNVKVYLPHGFYMIIMMYILSKCNIWSEEENSNKIINFTLREATEGSSQCYWQFFFLQF